MNAYTLKSFPFALLLILYTGLAYSQNERHAIVRENRDVAAFKTIKVKGSLNVVLRSGNSCKVVVEAPEGNLDQVITEVKDEILTVKSAGVSSKGAVYAILPLLEGLYVSGIVSVTGDSVIKGTSFLLDAEGASSVKLSIETDRTTVKLSGASKAELSGLTTTLDVDISGASYLEAGGLIANTANINASGASRANISAKESAKGDLKGVSKLTFKQKPASVEVNNTDHLESVIDKLDYELNDVNHEKIEEPNSDTTELKFGKTKIIIIEDTKDKVTASDNDKKKKDKFKGHWAGMEMGYNGYLASDNSMELPAGYEFLDLKDSKSIGVNINVIQKNLPLKDPNMGLITGIGLTYNNYRFANNVLLVSDSMQIFGFKDFSYNYQKSKLTAVYLTVPLIFEVQTGKVRDGFHIGGGIIGGFRIGTHTKAVYKDDGKTYKPKVYDDFYLNPFKCDATLRAGFGSISLFANYSLISLFKKNKGPKLYPFMIGISFS